MSALWPYVTPGVPDDLFEQLPGIPISQREVRLLLLGYLRLKSNSVLWDIGAGTGTLAIEAALLCPHGQIIAVERDQDVANLIRRNCDRFGVSNIAVIEGSAPDCLLNLTPSPDCVFVEGGKPLKDTLQGAWKALSNRGRLVVTASNFETLYVVAETLAALGTRNVEAAQPAVNRLETRGSHQVLTAVDPIFVISGEKMA